MMLPANATHLFQPLDVALFKPFKTVVQQELQARICAFSDPTISKIDAVRIACNAYRQSIMDSPQSAIGGFRGTGVWPLSLVQMRARLALYQTRGVKGDVGKAPWLVHAAGVQAQVRNQVLLLPPEKGPKKKRQRTTVDVAGRLITKELLLRGDLI